MEFTSEQISALNQNSLYETLGIEVVQAGEGRARAVLRPNPAVCWPFARQPHGGVLYTLMDTAMAWAVITRAEPGHSCATISMEVQYTQRARGEKFFCDTWVTHQAGRTAYTRADVTDPAGGLLATAQAAFRVIKA